MRAADRNKKARKYGALLRFVAAAAMLVILLVCLPGCTGFYGKNDGFSGHLFIRVSDWKTRAFAAEYYWNGDTSEAALTITIPDEFKGTEVTALGGYIGTGVLSPFRIVPSTQSAEFNDEEHAEFVSLSSVDETVCEQRTLKFTLNIGKNISKINNIVSGSRIAVREADGSIVIYTIDFCFECSPDNTVFYSRDGILYSRSDDRPAAEVYGTADGESD